MLQKMLIFSIITSYNKRKYSVMACRTTIQVSFYSFPGHSCVHVMLVMVHRINSTKEYYSAIYQQHVSNRRTELHTVNNTDEHNTMRSRGGRMLKLQIMLSATFCQCIKKTTKHSQRNKTCKSNKKLLNMVIQTWRNQPVLYVLHQFISDITNSECWIVISNFQNMIPECSIAYKITEFFSLEHKQNIRHF